MTETKLVLGRGELHFDRFLPGTTRGEGERYIGNSTEFSITRTYEEIERIRSIRGSLTKREGLIVKESVAGSLATDNVAAENLALWFGAEKISGQEVIGFVTELFTVRRDRLFHLGRSYNGLGVRWIDDLTMKIAGKPVVADDLLDIDYENGEFRVRPDSSLTNGTEISLTFQWRTSPDAELIPSEPKETLGALRFKALNVTGTQRDYLFPCVAIRPPGDAALKGDQWQQFRFDIQARRVNSRAALMYATLPGSRGYTRDEKGILDYSGVTFQEFIVLESQFDVIINIDFPNAFRGRKSQKIITSRYGKPILSQTGKYLLAK